MHGLKQCLQFDDGGVKPIEASGSRWISHKLNALKRVLSVHAHTTQLEKRFYKSLTDWAVTLLSDGCTDVVHTSESQIPASTI